MDIDQLLRLTELHRDGHPSMDITVLDTNTGTQFEILSLNWDEENKKFFLVIEEFE